MAKPSLNVSCKGPLGDLHKFPASGRRVKCGPDPVNARSRRRRCSLNLLLGYPKPAWPLLGQPHQRASRCPHFIRNRLLLSGPPMQQPPPVSLSSASRQSQLCFLPREAEGAEARDPLPFLSLVGSLHGCENNLILKGFP